ncbi:MAG: InlB B-repeat-containing protein, partial [Treponema sp.]|nr:InlB B-repeat-containing protein [Treponema sp.]
MKNSKFVYCLIALAIACVCLGTCENPVMEKWWNEPDVIIVVPPPPPPISHADNFFIVTFDTDGGTPHPGYQKIMPGGKVAKVPAVLRTGFGFGGWYTDQSFTNQWNFDTDTVDGDGIVLYAKWVSYANSRIVTFVTNTVDGSSLNLLELDSQLIAQGAKITEPPPISKTGYGFGGWYADGYAYPPPAYEPKNNNHPEYFHDLWDFSSRTVGDTNITLFAKWDAPHCTVTFVAGGGSPAPVNQDLIRGAKVVEPLSMNREGYGFGGWYKDPGCTNQWSFPTDTIGAGDTILTLYAKWAAAYYTVTFDAGDGTPAPGNQIIQFGTKAARPLSMSRTGYGFGGWYTDPYFNTPWNFETDTVTTNMTLYAKWEAGSYNCTVIFDAGGGTPAPENQIILRGAKATEPPAVSRAGNSFRGWYTDPEFDTFWDFETDAVTANTTLYAKWEAAGNYTCTVRFDAGGATPAPDSQTIVHGEKAARPSSPGSRSYYEFGGWYADPDFNTLWNFETDTVVANTTIYAKWAAAGNYICTVHFDAGGGTPVPINQTIPHGAKALLPPVMNKPNYGFIGWYTDPYFNTQWNFETDFVEANTTLYAKWEAGSYNCTVIFDAGGGTPAPNNQTIIYGARVTEPPAMNKSSYNFRGWYTDPYFNTFWDFGTDTVIANMTLYAKWEAGSYTCTVRFDAGGGTPAPDSQTVAHNAKATRPPVMSRDGYGFGGWYKDSAYNTPWNFETNIVEANTTLYAKWDADSFNYTVTFIAEGGIPAPNSQTIAADPNARATRPPAMSRTGYGFGGWYKEPSFNTLWNFETDIVIGNTTLYAKWEAGSYTRTVTFDAGSGTPAPDNQTVTYGAKAMQPPAMSRAGYGFGGWYKDPYFNTQWNFETDTVAANTTLYAKWEASNYTRTVTFNAGGGTPAPGNQTITQGAKATQPPAMSRTGYGFGGWYTDSAFNTPWNFGMDTVTADTILYAKWVAGSYTRTVTFDANGGTPAPIIQTIAQGAKATQPPAMSKAGYGFGGWYTDPDFNTEWHFGTDTVIADMTLYAEWVAGSYTRTVTFDADGGTPAPGNQTITQGAKATQPPAMSRAGYGFGGWYTDPYFNTPWNFETDIVTADMTIYAKWVGNSYTRTVTFDADGGTPAPGNQTVTQGAKVTQPPAMSKTGYGFGGWYADPSFSNTWNFGTNTVTADMTIYAKWDMLYSTVSFDAGGGTPAPDSQRIAQGAKIVEPFAINKEGYGFVGWYKDSGFNTPWNFGTDTVTADTTIYAKWVVFNYTISFNAGGGTPAPNNQTVTYNTKATQPPAMSRSYYGFGGWYADPDFNTEWNFETGVTANMTLYAKWEAGSYTCTVTFDAEGGTPVPDSQTITHGAKATRPPAMSKTGYGFSGWYTDPYFNTPWNFETNTVIANMTLYAKWEAGNYTCTVTFDAGGGTPAPGNQTITHGAKATQPPVMSKPNYGFVGWYADPYFNTPWNFETNTVIANMTLYAKWDAGSYTCAVTFDAGGGTPAPSSQTVTQGAKAMRPPAMNKPNYGFSGWYADPYFNTPWNFETDTVTANMTLYAKWEAGNYNCIVTFDAGDGTPAPVNQTITHGAKAAP